VAAGFRIHLDTDGEENEDLQHKVVAVSLELVELCFSVGEGWWKGLLGFSVDEFAQVHGSGGSKHGMEVVDGGHVYSLKSPI